MAVGGRTVHTPVDGVSVVPVVHGLEYTKRDLATGLDRRFAQHRRLSRPVTVKIDTHHPNAMGPETDGSHSSHPVQQVEVRIDPGSGIGTLDDARGL